MRVVKCDNCGAEIVHDTHYFAVNISNGIWDAMYDLCTVCIKYQKLPITDKQWREINVLFQAEEWREPEGDDAGGGTTSD